jgi:predicted metallopeptidase
MPPTPTTAFDLTGHIRLVCEDMVARLPELAHIDLSQVAFGFCQTRARGGHGIQATLTPMRFENGATTTLHSGKSYTVERLYDRRSNKEILYILSLYVPRFLNHPLEEKLTTIIHELWHISPHFNGDLRRFGGRCYAHGASQKAYDAHCESLARRWLAQRPPAALVDPLRRDFRQLRRRHGQIVGARIPRPKLLPL